MNIVQFKYDNTIWTGTVFNTYSDTDIDDPLGMKMIAAVSIEGVTSHFSYDKLEYEKVMISELRYHYVSSLNVLKYEGKIRDEDLKEPINIFLQTGYVSSCVDLSSPIVIKMIEPEKVTRHEVLDLLGHFFIWWSKEVEPDIKSQGSKGNTNVTFEYDNFEFPLD